MTQTEPMEAYFSGAKLWGDDFSEEEIGEWFQQERDAYADLIEASSHKCHGEKSAYTYGYHSLNALHGYRHLPSSLRFPDCLGIGAAYGIELLPIVDRVDRIEIVEPSEWFHKYTDLQGVPITYHLPVPSGVLPFDDKRFDLTTCLGCLHHIPNVSKVVSELHRVCTAAGFVLIRDPIHSMGDWREERRGLTRNERGIPIHIFDAIVRDSGFTICRRTFCAFPPFLRLWHSFFGGSVFSSCIGTRLDALQCALMRWNAVYHRTKLWQKFAPGAVYYVLRRDD